MRKKARRRIKSGIFLFLAVAFAAAAVYLILFYNYDAYKRQETEESVADLFIEYLLENAESLEGEEETTTIEGNAAEDNIIEGSVTTDEADSSVQTAKTDEDGVIKMGFDFEDVNYYERNGITYTPDYARGYLLCVLEFPSVGIRRGVYSGTWDDIYYDLDIWMVTAAHPDMRVGKTHLSIYGHNHTAQNLSFNNLKNAQTGDKFYLYAESGVYTYEVTNIFSEWRETATAQYVDDFSIGADTCYIITCGRDEHRYKDLIVEGHLVEYQTLTEYAAYRLEEANDKRNFIQHSDK